MEYSSAPNSLGLIDKPTTLLAAILISAVGIFFFNVEPVVLGALADALSLSPTQQGSFAAVEVAGIGIASISAVFWIRRVNWRRAVQFGLGVMLVGNLACTWIDSFASMLLLRGIIGLCGEGVVFAVVITLFGDTRNPDRAFALSIAAQVGLGAIGLLLLPPLFAQWALPGLMVAMALMAALALTLAHWIPDSGASHETLETQAVAEHKPYRTTVFLGLSVLLTWFVGVSAFWSFSERIAVSQGLSSGEASAWLAAGLLMGLLGSLLAAWAGDRFGRFWQAPVSIFLHAITAFAFAQTGATSLLIFIFLSFTFIWNIGLPYVLGIIANADVSGRLVVLIIAAEAAGNAIGPLLGGAVAEVGGYAAIGHLSGVSSIIALCLVLIFIRRFQAMQLTPSSRKSLAEST